MPKIDFNKITKLQSTVQNKQFEDLQILSQSMEHKIKTFRLRSIDVIRLTKAVQKTNDVSQTTKFKEADIIRALLMMVEEMPGEKIINFIRKSI